MTKTLQKTVFFDRDGTLIIDRVYLNDPDQITYLPGCFEGLAKLRDAGFQLVMVTNQSGIARGIVSLENLAEIHRRMVVELAKHDLRFAGIYFAPYAADSDHEMRKPNPGMLMQGARELGLDLARSWMVGDRMSDIEAGRRAGCKSVLLAGTDDPERSEFAAPDIIANDLTTAIEAILAADLLN